MSTIKPYGYDASFDDFISRSAIGFENYDAKPNGTNRNNIKLLDDLQANILKHHRKTYSAYLMITFKNDSNTHLGKARDWITQFGNKLTSAKEQLRLLHAAAMGDVEKDNQTIRCFYLTNKGYTSLGASHLRPWKCASFKKGFREEIAGSFHQDIEDAYALNDEDDIDAMALIATNDLDTLSNEVSDVFESVGKFATINYEIGFMKKEGKTGGQDKFMEWFGYADGFSGPRFFPDTNYDPAKEGTDKIFANIPSLKNLIIRDRGGKSEFSAGSYLSFLKLKQDNAAYEELVRNIANKIEFPKKRSVQTESYKTELAEAYIMGRFKDGTPVTLRDVNLKGGSDNSTAGTMPNAVNDFNYKEFIARNEENENMGQVYENDDQGVRCPYHSHIRKVKPRGYSQGDLSYDLVRRSVLYFMDKDEAIDIQKRFEDFGAAAVNSQAEILKQKDEVGMLFMAFQNNLEQQFEATVNRMHSNFNKDGISSGKDILTSDADQWDRKIPATWNGSAKNSIERQKPLIHLKGGKYFFAPSISFLSSFNQKCYPPIADTQPNGSVVDSPNPVSAFYDMQTGGMKRKGIKSKMNKEKIVALLKPGP